MHGQALAAEEQSKLDAARAALTDADVTRLAEETRELKAAQASWPGLAWSPNQPPTSPQPAPNQPQAAPISRDLRAWPNNERAPDVVTAG